MAVQQGSEFQSLTGYSFVEEVHSSPKTLVYRAIRLADQQPVVIKLLRQDYPSFAELLQFRNQSTLTQAIDSDAIIRHYDLLPFRNGYALVMEDFGAISLRQYLYQQRLGLEAVLTIALQLTDALAILHQQRIIHKDIKPANILINPESHQIKLTDFSVSSLLPRETQEAPNPQVIEGTLAYLSPEQTGRMNRGVDYRSDYYSLGVTLFELLTQQLPFPSMDPLELLHSHMAVKPPLVSDLVPSVPLGLARIVQKLMAKNAEDRYQTALGLKHDLQHCLQQYRIHGTIDVFELGHRDVSDRFLLPERLYGRQAEVSALLEAFDRIVDPHQAEIGAGGRELILITGLSGIGKTSVVNEVYKPIARGVASLQGRRQGYFIRGKFDQVQRNVPLFAFVQAFRSLIGQLLAETDQQIAQWKTQLQAALGDSAQVIIDVIPELEQILGAQPPAPELLGSAAQNRYNRLFQQFIQVFATPEHPLVIFLDDLQWADRASLNLMQLLLGEVEGGALSLLLIGAYRDNEVTPAHPLMLMLRQIQQTVRTTTIALKPLTREHVNQLVAATLSRSTTETPSLTELVYQKAQGNPFFTRQFIKSLYTEGAIAFDRAHQLWEWDLAKVQLLALAEDVVDFMATQLQKLAPPTQEVLQLAACIGSQFNLATLAIAAGRTPTETAQDLWNALQVGFLVPLDENYRVFQQPLGLPDRVPSIAALSYRTRYRFMHDRVQQAAYSLIPDDRKPATHLKIGRFLLQKVPPQQREEHLFDILNQLNAGLSLVTEPTQRLELAELNLAAGRKAKQATAYDAADIYLAQGRSLLPEGSWHTYYDLTLALWLKSIEIAYLRGDYAPMQALAETVLNEARSLLDRIPVYEVLIQAYVAQHQMMPAVQLGLQVLDLLGAALPKDVTEAQVMESFQAVTVALDALSLPEILDLPVMTDPVGLAVMRISLGIAAAAYNVAPSLYILLVLNLVQQSLRLGNAAESAYAYASYGFIVNAFSGQVDRGYELNQLALQLLTNLNAKALTAKTLLIYHGFVQHWKEPLENTLAGLQEGYTVGLETGDLEFSAYCAYLYGCHLFYRGRDLPQLDQEMGAYSHAIGQMNQTAALNWQQLTWQAVRNLLGGGEDPIALVGDIYDERFHLPRYQANGETVACCYVYLNRLLLGVLFRRVENLGEIIEQAETCLHGVVGLMVFPLMHFYGALALLALYPAADPQATLAKATLYLDKLEQWAQASPTIYTHKWQLVLAEQHRVLGDRMAAIEAYDRAIAGATEQGYQQDAALANELAAEFYFAWGKDRIAQAYLLEAYYGYARWGATVKVLQLEQRYGSLLAPTLRSPSARLSVQESVTGPEESSYGDTLPTHASSSTSAALDRATILRVSQALSREIQVDRLIEMLLHVVIESAGADRCALVTLMDDRLMVEAIAESNTASQMVITLQSVPLDDCPDLPVGALYSVKRSKQAMLITDALAHPTVSADPYIVTHQPKSLLCTPIVQQGKLFGLLYLENHLTIGAFTHDRIELINLLCTQAAISLENARLYERSQTYAQQLEESLAYLQESEARFQRLADNVPGMIYQFYLTPEGQKGFSYVSSGCWDIYGISPEVAMEQGELLLMAPTAAAQALLDRSVLQSAQNLTPWQWEGLIRLPSGQVKWIQAASRPERLEDGTIQWDGVVIDIDDRKQAEAALRQSEAELRQKSQELEQILQTLKSAQLQLVQSEKMSALGNLVAGVAHEINNPIGFLAGNLRPAQDYVQDLLRLMDQYQTQFPKPGADIEATIDEIDLDYVREDLPKLLSSMQLGIDRIRNISTGLRTFSRADKDYKVPFNLHEGIDSTILILQHRLKANSLRPAIEIVRNYADMPEIEGFPGQMNQVFMNLLANAIDALDEQFSQSEAQPYDQRQGCITITTAVHEETRLKIQIADNGIGMTEETCQRIFDHLFTTKEVGKGTGLGLAIARQIVVEKHGGTIEVNSRPGEGTEFVIGLPIGTDTAFIA